MTENPTTVLPTSDKPMTENPIQLITNKLNTDLINNRINNILYQNCKIFKKFQKNILDYLSKYCNDSNLII